MTLAHIAEPCLNAVPGAQVDLDPREVVLVTGSSEFIGSAVVKQLADRFAVIGLDRPGALYPPPEAECIEFPPARSHWYPYGGNSIVASTAAEDVSVAGSPSRLVRPVSVMFPQSGATWTVRR